MLLSSTYSGHGSVPIGGAEGTPAGCGDFTVTTALALLVPPAPLQFSVYELVTNNAPVDVVPLVAFAPLQNPAAVQVVAFVELHVSVELLPGVMVAGAADNVTVGDGVGGGGGCVTTVTVVLALPCPLGPLQVNEYVEVTNRASVCQVPDVAAGPIHAPEAAQLVALVDDHFSVVVPPVDIVSGIASSVTVGDGTES